jgi:ParB family chromosome partitioning protein
LKLPSDFAKKISETLSMAAQSVEELFEIYEDKQGFFIAKLRPKQWLDKAQFKTMCALARGLGGEGYLQGAKAWMVPGPCAKKADTTSTPEDARSKPSEGPRPEAKKEPSGVAPKVLTEDKSRPPQFMVPLKALLSMPFQCRTNPDDPEMAELTESIRTLGVLQPILVRPKPNGLYEIVYGQRRAKAAEKAGLIEIPANIRILSDQEAYEIQFTENLQREDLSNMEKARMLDFLTKKFGYTQEALAQKLGKSKGWVSRHIAMLELEKVAPGQLQTGEITERQAREILAAPEEKREEILDQINETGEVPSARELHEMRRAEQPEQLSEPMGPTPGHLEPEREPRPEEIDTGYEWTCPECEEKFQLIHVKNPDGSVRHKLEAKD